MGSSKRCEGQKPEVTSSYNESDLTVLFEPTSAPKSTSIFSKPVNLELFPTSSINIVTPNIFELEAMHRAAQENGHFESSQWWSILDSFRISSRSRQGLSRQDVLLIVDIEILLKGMPDLISKGTVQQAIQLLPYIPDILIKLGERGVLSVRLCPKKSVATDEKGTLRLQGVHGDVCVRLHPGLKHSGIVSVTGAGYLVSLILANSVIHSLAFYCLNCARRNPWTRQLNLHNRQRLKHYRVRMRSTHLLSNSKHSEVASSIMKYQQYLFCRTVI